MHLLIDTHVFLWWDTSGRELSKDVREALASVDNTVYVSAASIWEIAIKRRAGKLKYAGSAAQAVTSNGFEALDISHEDCEEAGGLEWDHSDPFDRLLVAQCRRRALTFVTADYAIRGVAGIPVLWAR